VEHIRLLICGLEKFVNYVQRGVWQNASYRPGPGIQPHSWEANTELTLVIELGCDEVVDECSGGVWSTQASKSA